MTTTLIRIAIMQFFGWWRGHLAEAMPFLFPDPDRGIRTVIAADRAGTELDLPQDLEPGESVIVQLDPSSVLIEARNYPFNVIGSVSELLEAEVDELTPFSSAEVQITHRLEAPDWSRRQFPVRFAVIRRQALENYFENISAAGFKPAGARVGSDSAAFVFLPAQGSNDQRRWPLAGAIRWLAVIGLLFAVAFVPSMKLQQVTAQRSNEFQAARESALTAAPVLERVQSLTRSLETLDELRDPANSALYVLAELSRMLPQDSWLESFEINDGRLRIVGFSPTPADVVATLSQSALLADIQYRAAGGADQERDAERFELTAKIVRAGGAP